MLAEVNRVMPDENLVIKTPDEIAEELEEEELKAMEEEALKLAEEEKRRREELERFAQQVTLMDVIKAIETIKRFIQVYRESRDILDELIAELGYEESEAQNPMLKMLMRGLF